jgi:hypothetical protein
MSDNVEGRGLTIRQRREMGLTAANIFRVTRELCRDGTIDKSTPREDVAQAVIDRLVIENPKAFADPSVDWDAILAFIEKLLPFILQIIALFGGI